MPDLVFLKEMIRERRTVGAIGPSGRRLAEHVTREADVAGAECIVEYGPGTGQITSAIMDAASDESTVLCLEINEPFVERLRRDFPKATVLHASATDVVKELQTLGRDSCDCIVSGLPFTLFDEELQTAILDATVEALRPGGRFVTFAYCLSNKMPKGRSFEENLVKHFNSVEKSTLVWKNFPPAFSYCAVK